MSRLAPADNALRDAWLAELWPVCREYNSPRTHNSPAKKTGPKADGTEVLCDKPARSKTAKRAQDRLVCPFCQVSYYRASLPRHLTQAHSADYEEIS